MSNGKRTYIFDGECRVPRCARGVTIKARSLCQSHYRQWRRGEEFHEPATPRTAKAACFRDDQGRKYCLTCKRHRPEADFAKQAATADGLQACCRECRRQRYYVERREAALDDRRRALFGLDRGDYDRMVLEQGNVCAICQSPPRGSQSWSIDHDHACCPGKASCGNCVRGLLCSTCNTALGMARDSPRILAAMIAYLLEHSQEKAHRGS